jgi:endonuclease III
MKVAVVNVAQHIITEHNSSIPHTLSFWTNCLHFGHKTAALLLFAVFNEYTTIPVDSHAKTALLNLEWSNGRTEEEISWQVKQWLPQTHDDYFIKLNDAFGSIGQLLNTDLAGREKLLSWSSNDKQLWDLLHKLA